MPLKITGKNPSGDLLKKIQQSPRYLNGGFQNLSDTPMMLQDTSYFDLIKKTMRKNRDVKPPVRLPSVITNLTQITADSPVVIWFGHSSYFIKINDTSILVDPVFSGNAAPVSFLVKAFAGSDVYGAADFPPIDYLILTHDHYDHLDYKTLLQFQSRVACVCCSLGVSSHLAYWGFDPAIIREMDWWQTVALKNDLTLTAVPARHFSGRGLQRCKTLWSSFVLKTPSHQLYLGGDSGYDTHFREIGEKFGPFSLAILESGQYNAAWPLIHMMPEQTVQAAIDLQAEVLLPVHWGKFSLALHPWNEPIERVTKAAELRQLTITTPLIGEPVILDQELPRKNWWKL